MHEAETEGTQVQSKTNKTGKGKWNYFADDSIA
jgi:hypothetical protein